MRKYIFSKLFNRIGSAGSYKLHVRYWDDSEQKNYTDGTPDILVHIKKPKVFWSVALYGGFGLIESYIQGDVDFEGAFPIKKFAEMSLKAGLVDASSSLPSPLLFLRQWLWERKINNANYAQAKANAISHYNLPGAYFRYVLGKTYGYTEGYYSQGWDMPGDDAQHEKFDYVCRQMNIKLGDSIVEVGSGWGYMSCLMAKKYGARVVNYGIVPEQNRVMHAMAQEWGVADKVTIVDKDHRELINEPNTYDKYVSIGVYEHAGFYCHEDWIKSIATSLKTGGTGFISVMGFNREPEYTALMTTKYIFPGGNLVSLPHTLRLMDKYGLTIVNIENLWHHYQKAIDFWAENFHTHWREIHALDPKTFDERFFRIWRMYLEGCGLAFSDDWGRLNVYHITFTKGRSPDYYPATRDFIYNKSSTG